MPVASAGPRHRHWHWHGKQHCKHGRPHLRLHLHLHRAAAAAAAAPASLPSQLASHRHVVGLAINPSTGDMAERQPTRQLSYHNDFWLSGHCRDSANRYPLNSPTLECTLVWDAGRRNLTVFRPPAHVVSKIHQYGAPGEGSLQVEAVTWKPDGKFPCAFIQHVRTWLTGPPIA